MAKDKKSFVAYSDWNSTIKKLSDEEAGKLVKMMFSFVSDENPEAPDRITELIFEPIKNQMERDLEKYKEVRQKRSESGRNGGKKSGETRSKTEQNEANASSNEANEANACFASKNEANEAVNVNGNVNVIVNDILLEKETKEENIIKENSDSEFFPDVTPIQDLVQDAKEVLRLQEEEKRKKVPLKKEKIEPPDLETFVAFAREMYQNELKVDFSPYEFAVKAKYDSWNDADWKDGHKKPIVVWKNKLRNTIPHLKPIYGQSTRNNTSTGFNSGYGNTSGGLKASGKISGRTFLAREIDKQSSGNSQSGDFTINAEVVK